MYSYLAFSFTWASCFIIRARNQQICHLSVLPPAQIHPSPATLPVSWILIAPWLLRMAALCSAPWVPASRNPFVWLLKIMQITFFQNISLYIFHQAQTSTFSFTEIEIKYKYLCVYNEAISWAAKENEPTLNNLNLTISQVFKPLSGKSSLNSNWIFLKKKKKD